MPAIKTRLTFSYVIVLMATMSVFAFALWSGQRSRAAEDLTAQVRRSTPEVRKASDGIIAMIRAAQGSGKQLTYIDTINGNPVVVATQALAQLLDPVPAYFLLLDKGDKLLYSSSLIRMLAQDDQVSVITTAIRLTPELGALTPLRNDSLKLLLVAHGDSALGANVSRVVAGLPMSTADLPAQLLLGTMIAILPLVLLLSAGVAYVVAGSALRQPVDHMINEVEAISDGRSLHRRLPADPSSDELSRLGTTLNAMLDRLEHSFGALRRFTADASHELKTPLTVLRADVERAMHPTTPRGDRMVALEEALQETARMSDLVDSLLTLARADEGRFDIYSVPVEVEPLVREVYETAVILGEHAGLQLALPTLENAVVMGDRTRLRQLLLNLVTNAIKYTPRGGRVEMSVTRKSPEEIAIVVRDTGIGISAAELPHVFERFWRADRARSRASERGGFGLGLSIAQWIVHAHGGTITAQSRLGRGSIFTVVLPASAPPRLPEGQAVTADKGESNIDFTNS